MNEENRPDGYSPLPDDASKLFELASAEVISAESVAVESVSAEGISTEVVSFESYIEDELEIHLDSESDDDFGLPVIRDRDRVKLAEWSAQDFSNIYVRFRPHLERHARRFLRSQHQVDEVVQDAFLYLMVTLPELDSEIGVLRFLKWKTRLLCLDVIRASGKAYVANLDDVAEPMSQDPEVSSYLEQQDDAAVLLIEVSGETIEAATTLLEDELAALWEEADLKGGIVAQSSDQARRFWDLREDSGFYFAEFPNAPSFDVSMPPSALDAYVADAVAWGQLLKTDPRFGPLIVLGHSEGALIASLAAEQAGASAVISVAGSGRPVDQVLREQLSERLPPQEREQGERVIEQLKAGQLSPQVPAALRDVFRPSVQPYLISLFRQDPAAAFAHLHVPALIVQGRNDVQVDVEDAERLHAAKPDAELALIDGMNHMLRISPKSMSQQRDSYLNPELPLARELGERIVTFIQHLPSA